MNRLEHNTAAFLWHAFFLSLAKNFMDMDVVLPAMVLDAGGQSFHVGLLTAILTGGVQLSLFLFTPFLSGRAFKKKYLLAGINLRILTLFGLSAIFLFAPLPDPSVTIWMILLFIALFAVGGSFANIGYVDILGKSVVSNERKHFFSMKQVLSNAGVLISAYLVRMLFSNYAYPENYRWIFLSAGVLLAIASLGFWRLREIKTEPHPIRGLREFILKIKSVLKENHKLKNYILLLNTQGVVLVLLPFLVLYSRTAGQNGESMIGNYLILKVIGGVSAGILVYYLSTRIRYYTLLYIASGIALSIPLLILTLPVRSIFPVFFLLGGMAIVFHLVSMEGILLELSTKENRVLYTGLVGAANVLPALFSLLAGSMIRITGINLFFGMFILIIGSSMFTIFKLDCQK